MAFKDHIYPGAKRTYRASGNETTGTGGRQLILHNTGVSSAASDSGVAAYVTPKGIAYHGVKNVWEKDFYQIIPFNKAAMALLNAGIAGGAGCNKAGKIKIQINIINNKRTGKELKGKLPNDFLDFILDICEEYNIPLQYLKHRIFGRCTAETWANASGISAHRYAPGNDHSDLPLPKSFLRQLKKRALARKKAAVTPSKPTETKPDTNTHEPAKNPANPARKTVNRKLYETTSGKTVELLQRELGNLKVDGDFGPATKGKVKAFQKQKGLKRVDGVVGYETWKALGYKYTRNARKHTISKNSNTKYPTDDKLVAGIKDAAEYFGGDWFYVSGWRTLAQQRYLWDLYQAGKGNQAAYPDKNAPHIRGVAADLSRNGKNIGEYNNIIRYLKHVHGIVLCVPNEPWHLQGVWSFR